jgi:hypothetical protein
MPSRLQTQAEWVQKALSYPQVHPQSLAKISEYTTKYGRTPDGSESAPWLYQPPGGYTPDNYKDPVSVTQQQYYDPLTGLVNNFGAVAGNIFDPTLNGTEPPPSYWQ